MNHQEMNRAIFKLSKSAPLWPVYQEYPEFETELYNQIENHGQLRFGQIVSNILSTATEPQKRYINTVFFGYADYDPFYDEPIKTLRLFCKFTGVQFESVLPKDPVEGLPELTFVVTASDARLGEELTKKLSNFTISGSSMSIMLNSPMEPKLWETQFINIYTYNKNTGKLISIHELKINSCLTSTDPKLIHLSLRSISETKIFS